MPLHDWTRVTAGTFHAFHLAWIAELQRSLNADVLPKDYYALAEQRAGQYEPDLLTLERRQDDLPAEDSGGGSYITDGGTLTVATAPPPPQTTLIDELDPTPLYALRRRTLTIRHASDRIVALLEIASPGNKDRQRSVEFFVGKAVTALQHRLHLMVIDLLPPGASDPNGLCDLIWEGAAGRGFRPPPAQPIGAASFEVAGTIRCYAEPITVGSDLPAMPLFFEPGWYVTVPLQKTYDSAYEGVPRRWKEVIEQQR